MPLVKDAQLVGVLQQFNDVHSQGSGDFVEPLDRRIASAGLQTAHVSAINIKPD